MVWTIAVAVVALSAATDNRPSTYKVWQNRQASPAIGRYGLPICTGMDAFEETRAMLDGKCWDR